MGADDPLKVFFLDVGQGDCTFVVPPEGPAILFDCADAYVAERFMADHEIADLAAVVVSHLDNDHSRGVVSLLRSHFDAGKRVGRLFLFADRKPPAGQNAGLRDLIAAALDWDRVPPHDGFVVKASHRDGEGPVTVASGPDWQVDLVLPWASSLSDALVRGASPNTASAVLRIVRGGTAILVGGDAPLGSWERLEEGLRPARVIRVPHHGGEIRHGGRDWATFADLYDAVRADTAVVSVGTNNGHGHPDADHAKAARRAGDCALLCTQMTRRCHSDPLVVRNEALSGASGVEWPYRHRAPPGFPKERRPEVPCAGTVVVSLDATGAVDVLPSPGVGGHARLLRRLDHPLCR